MQNSNKIIALVVSTPILEAPAHLSDVARMLLQAGQYSVRIVARDKSVTIHPNNDAYEQDRSGEDRSGSSALISHFLSFLPMAPNPDFAAVASSMCAPSIGEVAQVIAFDMSSLVAVAAMVSERHSPAALTYWATPADLDFTGRSRIDAMHERIILHRTLHLCDHIFADSLLALVGVAGMYGIRPSKLTLVSLVDRPNPPSSKLLDAQTELGFNIGSLTFLCILDRVGAELVQSQVRYLTSALNRIAFIERNVILQLPEGISKDSIQLPANLDSKTKVVVIETTTKDDFNRYASLCDCAVLVSMPLHRLSSYLDRMIALNLPVFVEDQNYVVSSLINELSVGGVARFQPEEALAEAMDSFLFYQHARVRDRVGKMRDALLAGNPVAVLIETVGRLTGGEATQRPRVREARRRIEAMRVVMKSFTDPKELADAVAHLEELA